MKQQYDKNDVLEAALDVLRTKGYEKLSVRAIAVCMNSSSMPVYSCFKNMADLNRALADRCSDMISSSHMKRDSGNIFLDLALGHIDFA